MIRISETVSGINYIIKLFYYNSQTEYTVNFPEDTTCDILIVGGGGGGSASGGGGGGAGQLVFLNQAVLNGQYNINIGCGGSGGIMSGSEATKGHNTTFDTITALGGGANTNVVADKNGGSGAGGDYDPANGGTNGRGTSVTNNNTYVSGTIYNYGNDGDSQSGGHQMGGGGGGAGTAGKITSRTLPGNYDGQGYGGDGLAEISTISYDFKLNFGNSVGVVEDNKVYFAGGGAGGGENKTALGTPNSISPGGKGGGGGGSGDNAINHTGSGGGGGIVSGNGGNGGSGIVIIRYSSTKTTENAIDSTTNKLQIPAGSVITKTIGTFSPYSLYWDGDLNDNTDNSYLTSSLSNLTPPLSISFWKKQDKLVSEETLSITDKLSLSINSNLAVKFSVGSTSEIIENQADLDWHFWTITSDGSSNQLYRDGRVLGNVITESLTLSATDELMIGSKGVNAYVDQNPVTEYTVLETDATNLVAWYKFDTGEELTDSVGNYPLTNDGSVSFPTDIKIVGKSSYFPNSDTDGF